MGAQRPLKALYLIETAFPLEQAAAIMAGEQSSGTFVKVPGETDELKANHAAEVEAIVPLGQVPVPSLPGAKVPGGALKPVYQRALVTLSWPLENMGFELPNLMATIAGNLFELGPFSGLKLLDVTIPDAFKAHYSGPKFGIEGTKKLTGVYGRPIMGTIIKPSVGLTPEQTAEQVSTLVEAGLDFIKDDELMADPPHSPFRKRVDAVMKVLHAYADRTGKMPMYAFNLSGDIDQMLARHDYLLAKGGTCIMASLNWVGISAIARLTAHSQLPLHGHRNGWGMFTRSEALGMEFKVFQKIFSLAGADHLHTNGIRNKFCETDESVITSVKACLQPEGGGYSVMPVLSSGQWAEQALDTYRHIGSTDLMFLCGGGITGHPDGLAAGVRSLQVAWEGAVAGKSIDELAPSSPELAAAIAFFRGKKA
jgi:ribulose-bisphosphate carboxylase large chain